MRHPIRKVSAAALLSLTACGGIGLQPPARVVVASKEQHRPARPQQPQRPKLTEAQRRAFHRWIIHVAFQRWLAGLPKPGMQIDGYPRAWHPCGGGVYPPCWRVPGTESATAGLYRAINPTGCGGRGCFGKAQWDPLTWNAVAVSIGRFDLVGLRPDLASAADQDLITRTAWAGGKGCGHWSAC